MKVIISDETIKNMCKYFEGYVMAHINSRLLQTNCHLCAQCIR